jgi:hypothetical protein
MGGTKAEGNAMTSNQGTEAILTLSKRLREVAPNVRDAISMKLGAKLMEDAAEVIERLAHFEPDIDVDQGEN